jgi:hypothetical protein
MEKITTSSPIGKRCDYPRFAQLRELLAECLLEDLLEIAVKPSY